MRITKKQLRRIIKEERLKILLEANATEEQINDLAWDVAGVDGDRQEFAEELELKWGIDLETHEIAQQAWKDAQ